MYKFYHYIWLSLGLIIISWFFYIRLIMDRLPRDITFEYNLYLIILYTFLTSMYLIRAGYLLFDLTGNDITEPNKSLITGYYLSRVKK